jgi:predicted amidophosphoribosyltransferase
MRHPLAAALSLLVPPRCAICAEPCASGVVLCAICDAAIASLVGLPFVAPGIGAGWAAARYEGIPRSLVSALKFGGRLGLARRAA